MTGWNRTSKRIGLFILMKTTETPKATVAKRLLIIADQSPYGSAHCRELLDMALAAAAFDQAVSILLRGSAVNWLRPNQAAEAIEQKSLLRNLGAAAIYGVDTCYAEAAATQHWPADAGMNPAIKGIHWLTAPEVQALLASDFDAIVQL